MLVSFFLGYVAPIVIVVITYLYYRDKDPSYHSSKSCWLTYDGPLKGSIYGFVVPVGTIVVTNLFSMVVVILMLVRSSTPVGSKADEREMAKSILKVVVLLTPVFGVTWALGFGTMELDPSTDGPMAAVVHYAFTIFNSFQVRLS